MAIVPYTMMREYLLAQWNIPGTFNLDLELEAARARVHRSIDRRWAEQLSAIRYGKLNRRSAGQILRRARERGET